MFNYLIQKDLNEIYRCIQAPKSMMYVLLNNNNNIYLRSIHINCVIDQGKYKKYPVKENVQTDSIVFRIILMLHTNM